MSAPKNRVCIWYDGTAEAAARFYAATLAFEAMAQLNHAAIEAACKGEV